VDVEDARTIGRRLRQIRKSRGKPLVVIAGLAGMSKSQLDRIERGEVALDRLSEIVALANALQIETAEMRCESRLVDPVDDSNIYVELHLQNLRLKDNRFDWFVPLDTVRRLRDQLTEHLDAVQ
jgi:transcriptional regulator with XRE-family HTH domain